MTVGMQLLGGPERATVSLKNLAASAWWSELCSDFPAFLTKILDLCTELSWLHLAVLSANPFTVKIVADTDPGSAMLGMPSPALLSLFAQPTLVHLGDPEGTAEALDYLGTTYPHVPDVILPYTCTPAFIKDAWAVVSPHAGYHLPSPAIVYTSRVSAASRL